MDIFSHMGSGYEFGSGMMGGFGHGMGIFPFIMMIAFWGLIAVGIIYAIRWLAASTNTAKSASSGGETALDILKKRYARGEIDKVEFEEKQKVLEG